MRTIKIITILILFASIGSGLFGCKNNNNKDNNIPMVLSTSPTDNAINQAKNVTITCTFNGSMEPTSINTTTFLVQDGAMGIAGSVHYEGITATFVPNVSLSANTKYTVHMTKGARSTNGNYMMSDKIWNFTTGSVSAVAGINLRTSANYVILAKTAINNSSTSNITGDLGLSPAATSYITGLSLTNATGYATSAQVTGKIYAADMAAPTPITLTTAVNDMVTAYNDAAGRVSPDFVELNTGNIGGKTLTPGLYKWSSAVTIPTSVTISGGADDVWIFQISGDLTMTAAMNVILVGGAQAKNIFWQVAGQTTMGATSHLEGTVLCMTGITLQTSASLNGRALAQTAVVMDANTFVKP